MLTGVHRLHASFAMGLAPWRPQWRPRARTDSHGAQRKQAGLAGLRAWHADAVHRKLNVQPRCADAELDCTGECRLRLAG